MVREAGDNLISVKEAAQKCGRNAETVRRWIWSGKLPAEKLGNQLFIKQSALESYCRETAVLDYRAAPWSRSDLIKRMRKLREQIRSRMGRDFTADEISDTINTMREERDNEISGLR